MKKMPKGNWEYEELIKHIGLQNKNQAQIKCIQDDRGIVREIRVCFAITENGTYLRDCGKSYLHPNCHKDNLILFGWKKTNIRRVFAEENREL